MLPRCRAGLLVLTAPLQQLAARISPILSYAATRIQETLYVQLQPLDQAGGGLRFIPTTRSACTAVTSIYTASARTDGPDIRVLLSNISSNSEDAITPQRLTKDVDLVLSDCTAHSNHLHTLLSTWFVLPTNELEIMDESIWLAASQDTSVVDLNTDGTVEAGFQTYNSVVLGGTFDRIQHHAGHKILLSESAIRAQDKITVGVTDVSMLQRKKLPELIQPIDVRISSVRDFLKDVKPRILHGDSVVPISDPFGPSIVDPALTCIVVSDETHQGGNAVNKKRREKGLSTLDVHVIPMIEDKQRAPHEETKISSSSLRIRLLGTLLQQKQVKSLANSPYIVGLTGGIASGKSSVCRRLEGLGAAVIDCDKLGHRAYLPGTQGFRRVVREFGQDVVGADGSINRRSLGAKVFQDRSRIDRLNQIVWPEIAAMAQEEVRSLGNQGCTVCVLDAAVLLEAGWDELCHEVWSCIIPKDEAMKRVLERDRLPVEKAQQRIDLQLSNQERVDRSHIVLCTLWEPEVTQKQVEKAWSNLMDRLPVQDSSRTKQPKL